MKLSQLTTEQALDALLQITPSVANIAHGKNALDAIGAIADFDGLNARGVRMVVVDRYAQFVTVLLRDHKDDLFNILAALNRAAPDEIKAQSMVETLRQIREVMDDTELTDFLSSFFRRARRRRPRPPPMSGAEYTGDYRRVSRACPGAA